MYNVSSAYRKKSNIIYVQKFRRQRKMKTTILNHFSSPDPKRQRELTTIILIQGLHEDHGGPISLT